MELSSWIVSFQEEIKKKCYFIVVSSINKEPKSFACVIMIYSYFVSERVNWAALGKDFGYVKLYSVSPCIGEEASTALAYFLGAFYGACSVHLL